MRPVIVACALAGAIAAPLSAQTLAPPVPDMSNAVPVPGSWRFATTPAGGEARFLDSSGRAQLVLTCNRAARTVTVGRAATGAAPFLQLWSSSNNRNLPASFNPATQLLSVQIPASDALLDGLAQSRGRIAVGVAGQALYVAPAWAEIGRVVEECRL